MNIFSPASPEQFFYDWWLFPLPLLAALLAVFVPGLAIGFLLGLRGKWLWAWAPPASVAVISVAALVAGKIGFTWGFLPVSLATVLLLLIVGGVRCLEERLPGARSSCAVAPAFFLEFKEKSRWQPVLAFVTVFLLATVWFATGLETPGAFAQTWDNAFHLNLAMMFTQDGNASTLAANISGGDPAGYYPAAWHALVSLVASVCSRSVVVATNALTVVVAFLVWPLSIYSLTSVVTRNDFARLLSIPLSLAFPQFPMGFIGYGTLYPNFLGYSFIPICSALLIHCLRTWPRFAWHQSGLIVITVVAAAFSHPNSIFVIAIFFVVITWWFTLRKKLTGLVTSGQSRQKQVRFIAAWSFLWFGIYVAWDTLCYFVPFIHSMRRHGGFNPVSGTYFDGLKQLLLISGGNSFSEYPEYSHLLVLPFTFLAWLGFVKIVRNPKRWLLCLMWIPLAFYYLVAAGMQTAGIRRYFVGIWYCDVPRVFAPIIFVAVPLAAIGTAWLARLCLSLFRKKPNGSGVALLELLATICLALITLWGPLSNDSTRPWVFSSFAIREPDTRGSDLVDSEELNLLLSLPSFVPEEDTVLANPWEGGTFAWALGQRRAVFPKVAADVYPPDKEILAETLDPVENPEVCSLIESGNAYYLLDLRNQYLWGGSGWGAEKLYPALDVNDLSNFDVVTEVGSARLLHYEACSK